MRSFFATLCLVAVVSAHMSFDEFVVKFNKQYESEAARQQAADVFKSNLAVIDNLNAQNTGARFGVNKFADMSPAAFEKFYLMPNHQPVNSTLFKQLPIPEDVVLPTSFDWRDASPPVVTPVYNQGQCGSCWAFSATEEIESQWALAGNNLTQLSMQQIVDCDHSNGDSGCAGGDTITAYAYVESAGGLMSFNDYPYTGEDDKCVFKADEIVAHITGFWYATTTLNETEMQVALFESGPLSICVDAATWQFYLGGVITGFCGQSIDHCVMITGFGEEKDIFGHEDPVWNVRNSWGSDWGYEGYLYVERNKNLCGIATEATLVTI